MARQGDREPPVESPDPSASDAPAPADGQTRWPTWEDIARLHRIPGTDGAVPEPRPELAEPGGHEADDEPQPTAASGSADARGDEATVVMAPVGDEPEPEEAGEPATEPQADATVVVPPVTGEPIPDPELIGDPETAPDPDATDDPQAATGPHAPPEPAPGIEPDREPPAAPARVSAFPATSSPASAGARVTAGPVPVLERDASVLDEFAPEQHRRRWPRRTAIAAGVLVLLAGGYVGLSYAFGDRVPHGATVAGVPIGGLTSSEAVARLTSQLADATGHPLTVTAKGVQAEIDPATAGLSFDPRVTVDRLTGVQLGNPRWVWRQVVGLGAVAPVTSVDSTALTAAVDALSGTLTADPVDGAIVFVDGSPHATAAADGWSLDTPAAVQQIADTWLVAARPLTLPTKTVAPAITQAETDSVVAGVAQRVSGGPVTVTIGDQTTGLTAATLAANAAFVPKDGTLVLQMNGQGLRTAVLAQLPNLETPGGDAHFAFQNNVPVVVPGTPGATLDATQVGATVAAAASEATGRTAVLQLVPTDPAQSTASLEALGIKEVVSEFDTPLVATDHIRDINIKQGLANLSGVLIRPGEIFTLSEALAPIDAAHGFVAAGGLVDGKHVNVMGGGLSQVSTTTFNAAYFAGFLILEHTPHSEYFPRYPEGREATLFTPQIDMKWQNDTPYGALVQGWVANGRAYVQIWSTKYWTVQSQTSARSNVHPPTTVYDQTPTCQPASAGSPGFTVSVTRQVYLGTDLKVTHTWTTIYQPQNATVCGAPPPGH